jgi:hypothetical protein
LLSDDISLTFRDELLDGAAEERRYSFSSAFLRVSASILKYQAIRIKQLEKNALKMSQLKMM